MKRLLSICIVLLVCFMQITNTQALEKVNLYSQSAYLFDKTTGLTYLEKESDRQIYPASMTKVLTVYTALQKIKNVTDTVIITQEHLSGLTEAGASVAGFFVGEVVTYRDLIYGALLPSGADACQALAILTYGSNEKLVEAMNKQCQKWNLSHTHFVNTTGLHNAQHYTTTREMATIVSYALDNQTLKKAFETKTYTSSNKKHTWKSIIQRGKESGVEVSNLTGAKSGFTDEAQLTMASTMNVENHELILVTADAQGQRSNKHLKDATNVYNYIVNNYHSYELFKQNGEIGQSFVLQSFAGVYTFVCDDGMTLLISNDISDNTIEINEKIPKFVFAPIEKGEQIGTVQVIADGVVLYEYPVKATYAVHTNIVETILFYVLGIGIPLTILVLLYKRLQEQK